MEIVGWSMSERLKSTLCQDALNLLGVVLRKRLPGDGWPSGTGVPQEV